jgi:hypothetical protein
MPIIFSYYQKLFHLELFSVPVKMDRNFCVDTMFEPSWCRASPTLKISTGEGSDTTLHIPGALIDQPRRCISLLLHRHKGVSGHSSSRTAIPLKDDCISATQLQRLVV